MINFDSMLTFQLLAIWCYQQGTLKICSTWHIIKITNQARISHAFNSINLIFTNKLTYKTALIKPYKTQIKIDILSIKGTVNLTFKKDTFKSYTTIVDIVKHHILSKTWLPGDRISSVRVMSKAQGLSPMTVLKAYEFLESEGWVYAKPRAGYYVSAHLNQIFSFESNPKTENTEPKIIESSYIAIELLNASKEQRFTHFGSAFPDPKLFPIKKLGSMMGQSARKQSTLERCNDLSPGNSDLRRLIAHRYIRNGINISADDIIITSGAMDALRLSITSVTKPGDIVAIESPSFYGSLHTLKQLGLNLVEIPSVTGCGVNIDELEKTIENNNISAFVFMSNFQSPSGKTISIEKKKSIYRLLAAKNIPIIEDDVYSELYFTENKPLPIKAFDTHGIVLHCSSFSKSLAPGFKVGWVVAGTYVKTLQRNQILSSTSAGIPNQSALAAYLQYGGYDAHLRRLRLVLEQRKKQAVKLVKDYFHPETTLSPPSGGYFLWLEFPKEINTSFLFKTLLEKHQISIAPGMIFSRDNKFKHCLRLNFSYEWNEKNINSLKTLANNINILIDNKTS
ncbi:aminotransferase-like domain-containing protein [Photobacterium alginatilyticum]|uniref:PLP-dependent aminotransferase family protein n=1 Tax=Photobacterium alginatilyticum TaxID=1775171 RepID=A0ABW9YLZ0_9GAMM|nr:PLP-dependent aminotransferase family protein [Photobacterium alginatilyticum]NBI54834.1 PLP-dependent aminotransferase family protein [Photobacterium alginatilyticum]